LKDLDEFAQELKQEERIKPLWELTIYPQFTCDWFIEWLDFCGPGWRHEFKRPIIPPPPLPRKYKIKEEEELEKMMKSLDNQRARRKKAKAKYREKNTDKIAEAKKRYHENNRQKSS